MKQEAHTAFSAGELSRFRVVATLSVSLFTRNNSCSPCGSVFGRDLCRIKTCSLPVPGVYQYEINPRAINGVGGACCVFIWPMGVVMGSGLACEFGGVPPPESCVAMMQLRHSALQQCACALDAEGIDLWSR